jgi:hypothetical protein
VNHRLEKAVRLVAQHAEYSGKAQLVQGCRNEIEKRFEQGQFDDRSRRRLLGILLGCRDDTKSQGSRLGTGRVEE